MVHDDIILCVTGWDSEESIGNRSCAAQIGCMAADSGGVKEQDEWLRSK
jgi:hypothetical protein